MNEFLLNIRDFLVKLKRLFCRQKQVFLNIKDLLVELKRFFKISDFVKNKRFFVLKISGVLLKINDFVSLIWQSPTSSAI